MSRSNRKNERGVALILVLIALMIVSAIGAGMLYSAGTETAINTNFRDEQKANAAALAGLQEARERMRDSSDYVGTAVYIPPPLMVPSSTAAGWAVYILNPASGETVDPWSAGSAYLDTEICNERIFTTSAGLGNPCGTNTSTDYTWQGNVTTASGGFQDPSGRPLDYKWVRINRKLNGSTPYPINPPPPPGCFPPLLLGGACLNPAAVPTLPTAANDPLCFDGNRQIPFSALAIGYAYTDCGRPPLANAILPEFSNVYVLTAYAQTAGSSPARRMLQMEVAPLPPIVTASSVTARGNVTLQGSLQINGHDNCSCDCGTIAPGTIATTSCASRPDKTCDDRGAHPAIFAGGTVTNNGSSSESIVSGATTNIQQSQPWPDYYNIDNWINRFKSGATYIGTCNNGSCNVPNGVQMGTLPTNFPPPGDPTGPFTTQVTYVDGSVTFNGGSGSGILIVNGDMNVHGGGFQFYGLILVKGQLSFTGGGNAPTNIVGGVLAGRQAYDTTTIGGSASIKYDICALDRQRQGQPFVKLGSREIPF